jgi:hypothetical protein
VLLTASTIPQEGIERRILRALAIPPFSDDYTAVEELVHINRTFFSNEPVLPRCTLSRDAERLMDVLKKVVILQVGGRETNDEEGQGKENKNRNRLIEKTDQILDSFPFLNITNPTSPSWMRF